jgi:hypothetical protein
MSLGKQVQLRFTITQHEDSIKVLYALKKFFKCGIVRPNKGKEQMKKSPIFDYRVNSLSHLNDIIIPFFEQFSLKTKKQQDFLLFRRIVKKMLNGDHLVEDKLFEIEMILNNYKAFKVNRVKIESDL